MVLSCLWQQQPACWMDLSVQRCKCTGAYNYSMASNYNRIPRLPVIMIKDGQDKLIVKRETYEDVIKNDI
mgnify:CR=1 FL=1